MLRVHEADEPTSNSILIDGHLIEQYQCSLNGNRAGTWCGGSFIGPRKAEAGDTANGASRHHRDAHERVGEREAVVASMDADHESPYLTVNASAVRLLL